MLGGWQPQLAPEDPQQDKASVCFETEDFGEARGGTGVEEEGALGGVEVFPVSAAEGGQAVHGNEALVAPPLVHHTV